MLKKEEAKLCGNIGNCEESLEQWRRLKSIKGMWNYVFIKPKWHSHKCKKIINQ